MAKTLTFKSLTAVLMLVCSMQIAQAQTPFFTETFDTGTWTSGGTNTGTEVWTWTTDPSAGFQNPGIPPFGSPTASTGYYLFNSDANGNGNAHDVTLTGPTMAIDCSGKTNVHMAFYTQYAYFSENNIALGISLDGTNFAYAQLLGGLPPLSIAEGFADIDLDIADGQPTVWVQFRYIATWQAHWKIDDIVFYEDDSAIPMHDVTFRVDANKITVDPAGMFLSGSFNNFDNLAMTNDGNGIWSATVALNEAESYDYKFKNGANGLETGIELCAVSDGAGGFNRSLTVANGAETLPAVCFNECAPCAYTCSGNPNSIICDDFESYNIGNVSPQSPHWIPWDLNDGANNIVGCDVVNTQASNGTKSMRVRQDGAAGDDQLLRLGNKSTGRYSLSWKYYIPNGRATYFNIQTDQNAPGASPANFASEIYFRTTGNVDQTSPTPTASGKFPFDQWFNVQLIVDLDNDLAKLYVDDKIVRAWPYTVNFGAIDFYAADATYLAFVDEVEYIQLPSLTYDANVCDVAIDLSTYFGQGIPQTTGIYDNTAATAASTDPSIDCWGENNKDKTLWFTFPGDGEKYHIETVPCDATNYITGPGDTQIAIYTGENCGDLTEIACNDDLSLVGDPDWRAGLDLETADGENYYMMIDGFNNNGTVATGEFCLQINRIASVPCTQAAVGTYTISSELLCWEAVLGDLFTLNANEFVIPNEGQIYGISWAISVAPLDPTLYPATDPNYLGSFQILPDVYTPGVPNDNSSFMMAGGIYYFTPVVVGNVAPGTNLFLHTVDATNACFQVGESVAVGFLPLTDDITASITAGNGSADLTPGGGIGAVIGDNAYYNYAWSNGATTQDLNGVPSGTYTVTVTDQCSESATATVNITTIGTKDPATVQNFVVSPNPTTGVISLNLILATSAEVRVEVLNTLGQTLRELNLGKLNSVTQNIDLSQMAQGAYFIRATVDGETALRRVQVQR